MIGKRIEENIVIRKTAIIPIFLDNFIFLLIDINTNFGIKGRLARRSDGASNKCGEDFSKSDNK